MVVLEPLPQFVVRKDETAPSGPPSSKRPLVVIGFGLQLAVATPVPHVSIGALRTEAGTGTTLAEAGAFCLSDYGGVSTVIILNAGGANAGAYGTIASTFADASPTAVTGDGTDKPTQSLQVRVEFTAAGTVGTAGIKYKLSLDGGENYFAERSLGTSTEIVLPHGGGTYNLAAGNVDVGDFFALDTSAPTPDADQITAAIQSLRGFSIDFGTILFADALDGSLANVIATELKELWKYGKFKDAVVAYRIPNAGETVTAYKTAFGTSFSGYSSTEIRAVGGAVRTYSPNIVAAGGQSRPLRSPAWAIAARLATTEPEDLAQATERGPLRGVALQNSLGTDLARCFNEQAAPWSVEVRGVGVRTVPQLGSGVYVTQDELLYAEDSPWVLGAYTRVINYLIETVQGELVRQIGAGYASDPGAPLSEERRRSLELGLQGLLESVGPERKRCSSVRMQLDATAGLNGRIGWTMTMVPNTYITNGVELVARIGAITVSGAVGVA